MLKKMGDELSGCGAPRGGAVMLPVAALCVFSLNALALVLWRRPMYIEYDVAAALYSGAAVIWASACLLTIALFKSLFKLSILEVSALLTLGAVSCASDNVVPNSLPGVALLLTWLCVSAVVFDSVIWKNIIHVIALVLSFCSSYLRQYGSLSRDAVEAIFQTNSGEVGAYLLQHVSVSQVCIYAGWVIATEFLYRKFRRLNCGRNARLSICVVVLFPLFLTAIWNAVLGAQTIRRSIIDNNTRISSLQDPAKYLAAGSATRGLDVILILGESSSRWNWSLYGYPNATNPRLESMSDELITLTDAVSPHSHTVPSLTRMFLRDSARDVAFDSGKVSLLGLLDKTGVAVEWHSAQQRYGAFSSPVSNIADQAHVSRFYRSDSNWSPSRGATGSNTGDTKAASSILSSLSQGADSGVSRFFVAHLEISHAPYCKGLSRVSLLKANAGMPLGKMYFGDGEDFSEDLSCYDEKIRMTEAIVANVIAASRESQRPTVVIFSPDHGEAPDEGTGHQSDAHSAKHIEIPVVLFFNGSARARFSDKYSALKQNARTPFLNSWLYEAILNIFEIKTEGLSLAENTIFDADFRPTPRVIFDGVKPIYYDALVFADAKDVLERSRLNMEKTKSVHRRPTYIYAHRVNSIGKSLEAKNYFDGLETDVYRSESESKIMVGHPPKISSGLVLQDLLKATAGKPELRYWLDLKTKLDAALVNDLLELNGKFSISKRVIIETTAGADFQQASRLAAEGWRVAFPLRLLAEACFAKDLRSLCGEQLASARSRVRSLGGYGISFDMDDSSYVRDMLSTEGPSVKMLAWNQRLYADSPEFLTVLANMPAVDEFVVKFKSKFEY